jgi:hypothetical protein
MKRIGFVHGYDVGARKTRYKRFFARKEHDQLKKLTLSGWGFRLPDQHRVLLDREAQMVVLAIPDRGAFYKFEGIEETGEEYRIKVGEQTFGSWGAASLDFVEEAYPFPTIDVELMRLRADWDNLGGDPQEFEAWQQRDELGGDETYDSKTSRLRAAIRKRRGE